MKRKVLAAVLAMGMAGTFVLGGCSGGSGDSGSDGGELVLYTWEAMFPQ